MPVAATAEWWVQGGPSSEGAAVPGPCWEQEEGKARLLTEEILPLDGRLEACGLPLPSLGRSSSIAGIGGALVGFSVKPRLPLTWSHSSLYFMAAANNYLHDLSGSPEQPYDIIMPISQARNEASETG